MAANLSFEYARQDVRNTQINHKRALNEKFEAILLVGSHAQGTARDDSDIDLVLLRSDYNIWLTDLSWIERFGKTLNSSVEDWGAAKTVRAVYEDGVEVEFNFANPRWASTNPIDPGTFRVVKDGSKILFDPSQLLRSLLDAVDTQ